MGSGGPRAERVMTCGGPEGAWKLSQAPRLAKRRPRGWRWRLVADVGPGAARAATPSSCRSDE